MKEMKSEKKKKKKPGAMADFHFSRHQRWARESKPWYHLKADAFSSVAPKCHAPSAKVLFTIYIDPAPVIFWSGSYRSAS